ncbi:MAG: APC family permease [Clostridiales Family XIII bacterium]|jgi:amino acid transporter|nr:APC family permease [Clostridiales Family XIII bacterium]
MAEDNVKSSIAVDTAERGLKKHKMSTFTVVFMIFSLVAAGCYGIEDMIPDTGPGLTLVILIVLPFIWGLPFGLVASELGSARPQEGGYYKWVQEALGEFWGFQAGWWRTVSIYIDNTLYVVLAGGYLAGMFNMTTEQERAFKIAMILVFMFINIRGVRDVGSVTNVLSIFVIVAFAMVAVIGFMNWGGNPFEPFTAAPVEVPSDWFFYIGGGLSVGMWMYSGYESMSTIAGELEDPQVISRATIRSVPLIMATYILPTMAALAAFKAAGEAFDFSNWAAEAGEGVIGYATVAEHFVGPAFGVFFIIVAIVAQCSIFNTYIASGSRGFFALADDGLAPPLLVKVDKKRGVPYIAVISVAVVNIALCMIPFKNLIVVDVFMLVSSYILVYISAMILRKRIPPEEYKFKAPGGYGFLKLICIMPICVAFFSFFINGTDYFIGGMVGIITGPILYAIWKNIYGGLASKDPALHPVNPRTRLAVGDLKRMSFLFFVLGIIGAVGSFFLPWYESGWVTELVDEGMTYADAFADNYDMTLFGTQEAMWFGIKVATVAVLVLAAIFYFAWRKVDYTEKGKAVA